MDDPEFQTDFDVDFTDEYKPDVELRTGSDTWRVWSVQSGSPGALGDLTCPYADDFTVAVANGSGGVGAYTVESIVLDPTSASNYSSLAECKLAEHLNGNLFVQKSSGGSGGDLSGTISIPGDLGGDVTAASVTGSVSVSGDLDGDIDIGEITGTFSVSGDLGGSASIDELDGGLFGIAGVIQEGETVQISALCDSSLAAVGYLYGTIDLPGGIPAGCYVYVVLGLQETGVVDLNDEDIAGELLSNNINVGLIDNVGDVSGKLTLVNSSFDRYEGMTEVDSVTGEIYAKTGPNNPPNYKGGFYGEVKVNNNVSGTIRIIKSAVGGGLFESTAVIDIVGNLSGSVEIEADVPGDVIVRGDVRSDGSIELGSDVDELGEVHVLGSLAGEITVDGSVDGKIDVDTNLSGQIAVAEDCSGFLNVDGYSSGDIEVAGDLEAGGTITVDDELKTLGRILLYQYAEGDITVGGMESNSLIYVYDGIEDDADILVALSQGDTCEGDIIIGNDSPPTGVVYDGSIKISDGISDGDMSGDITINGCHATDDDLDLCICGTMTGTVTINQTSYAEQVDYSCVSGCP